MSDTQKYLVLKMDEASAEGEGRTRWTEAGEVESERYFLAEALGEWLDGQSAIAAGTYWVLSAGGDRARAERVVATPRVEWDVEAYTADDEAAARALVSE